MNPKQKKLLTRIIVALVLFVAIEVATQTGILRAVFGTPGDVYAEFALFLIPYLIAGYDVIAGALRGLAHGHALDEDFLMTVATFGAFALVLFPDTEPHMAEGAAVMLFFQVGELFQSYAVDKSRQSIADMMDIAPEFANVMEEGELKQIDPFELAPDDEFIVMPGERIPLDGTVLTGESQIDTAALTGESVPRTARPGDEVISGCVNLTAKLVVRATKPFEDSTVSRILELVENAAEIGDYLLAELHKIGGLKEVRGRGLMIGIEIDGSGPELRKKLLFDKHIFTGGAGASTVRLLPALCLTKEMADRFLTAFDKVKGEK